MSLFAYRRGVFALAFVACLAGCAGQQTSPAGPIPQTAAHAPLALLAKLARPVLPPNHDKSWMTPDAKRRTLLYVSDTAAHVVNVYTYPYLKYVGQLTGFAYPLGECSYKDGNVWIADAGGTVYEYQRGYGRPIAILTQGMYEPLGCAINPANEDLAVANGNDDVLVFKAGSGQYTTYTDFNFAQTTFLGYDNHGNLFVDGLDNSGFFHYAELPRGASAFTDITLSGFPTISSAGSVQWDGAHMVVGDTQSTLYRIQGSKVVSTTTLSTTCAFAFYIASSAVIAPDQCSANLVGVYAYPAGGAPTQTVTSGLYTPYGAVLSR